MQFGWPRLSKPERGASIDPTHSLSQQLLECWAFNEGSPAAARDLVSGATVTVGSVAPTYGSGPDPSAGSAVAFSNSNNCYLKSNATVAPAAWTIAVRFEINSHASYQSVWTDNSGGKGLYIAGGVPDVYNNADHKSTATIAIGAWATVIAAYNGTAGTFWVNGASAGTWTASTPWVAGQVYFGSDQHSEPLNGSIAWAMLWGRALAPSEALQVSADPWQVVTPGPLWSWVFFQGSGAISVSGSGGVVAGGTAAPSVIFSPSPAGGVVAGGTAAKSVSYSPSPAGGTVVGGTAVESASYAPSPAGGAVLGGTAPGSIPGASAGLGYWYQVAKPGRGQSIDVSHPLANGLIAAWIFNEGSGNPVELIGGNYPSAAANFAWGSGSGGMTGVFNGSTTNLTYSSVPAVGPAISVVCGALVTSVSGGTNAMLIERSNVNATWALLIESGGLTWRGASSVDRNRLSGGISSGVPFIVGVTDTGTGTGLPNGSTMYLQGTAQTNNGLTGSALPAANTHAIHLGNYDNSGYFLGGQLSFVYVYNYALSPAYVAALSLNPWQIFRKTWIFAAGGGSSFTGSTSGGVVAGGTTAGSSSYTASPAGGAVAGGTASPSAGYSPSPSGGVVCGGTAAPNGAFSLVASGGVVLGGHTIPSVAFSLSGSGGIVLGGTASPSGGLTVFIYVDPDAGSLITTADDMGYAEIDPDAGSLITTADDMGYAEIDPDGGSLIIL